VSVPSQESQWTDVSVPSQESQWTDVSVPSQESQWTDVSVPSQESQWACFCVSGYRFCLLLPFLLGFGNVPTVWYILFFNLKLLFSGVCSWLFQNCITHVDRIVLCNSID
jgi:hypothetical protein